MNAPAAIGNILITGGTRGIGLHIALAFAQPGNRIFLNYAHDKTRAETAAAEINNAGADCSLLRADLATISGCQQLGQALGAQLNGQTLNLLVHGAVDPLAGPLLSLADDDVERALALNGLSLPRIVKALRPCMADGTSIVFITSSGGRRIVPNYAPIGMGKAMAECAMRYLAVELAPHGIRINAIAPAVTETDALRRVFGDKTGEVVRQAATSNPSGRGVEPDDYTGLVRWLASPEARFVQGQVISVNGGSNLVA